MHEPPADLPDDDVRRALARGWAIEASVTYAPVGFGSHHWLAAADGSRWFVTVDDLDHKPALGHARTEVLGRLAAAHLVARRLHDDGLDAVVAPLPLHASAAERPGAATAALDGRWAMSVTPYVEGTTWGFDDRLPAPRRDELVTLLARLHDARIDRSGLRVDLPPSGRAALVSAMEATDEPWTGGPYAEPARAWAGARTALVADRLAELDAVLSRTVAADLVVTHGEPHPGNLIGTDAGLRLVDWDTVALGPRERDLWLVGTDDATVAAYEHASGHVVDRRLLAAYRLAWDLADVASFLDELRAPHGDTADSRAAYSFLTRLELAPL